MLDYADTILETERLAITELFPYYKDDVAGVINVLGDWETVWWYGVPQIDDWDLAQGFLRWGNLNFDGVSQYGVYHKESKEMIGFLQTMDIKDCRDTIELGYALSVESRGKGYMTEAVKAMCEWLSNDRPISKIRCRILPENEASIALATRCGFTRVKFGPDGVELDPDDYAILEKVVS